MKVASMVTGILSLIFCFVPVLGIVLGIVGICTAQGSAEEGKLPGMAAAGLTCGIIGVCIGMFASSCVMCAACA